MKPYKVPLLTVLIVLINTYSMEAQNASPVLSSIKAVTMRLKPGEDLKAQLDDYVNTHHIAAACIVTCVGSLQTAVIRYANRPNADTLHGHFEIVSLTGTLATSGSHLHIAISDSTGKTSGGHLKEGSIIYTTAEIVLGILPGIVFSREMDTTYGYMELMARPK